MNTAARIVIFFFNRAGEVYDTPIWWQDALTICTSYAQSYTTTMSYCQTDISDCSYTYRREIASLYNTETYYNCVKNARCYDSHDYYNQNQMLLDINQILDYYYRNQGNVAINLVPSVAVVTTSGLAVLAALKLIRG